jgi:galactose mutarotase-like enzyme
MFSTGDLAGPIGQVALEDAAAGSRALIAPSRGGMATHLFAHGREWLYLDEATFLDPSKNVRGGSPVLFPSPGKLAGDAWSRAGKSGRMGQHGFARNRAWREAARESATAASVTLELTDDAESLAVYPWPFRAQLRYALAGSVLRIDIKIENRGDSAMPFGFGFHPYFAVPQAEKAQARIPTRATRAWDNVQKREVSLERIDLASGEVDLHLHGHGGSEAQLQTPRGTVTLRGSPEFSRWVVWTLPGRDFVCLEPWTSPGDALNTGEGLLELSPGASRELWLELSVAS